jgi:hypothetical protein
MKDAPPPTSDKPRTGSHPAVLRMFADHGWAARMWFAMAMVLLLAVFIQPFALIAALRTRERVVILDEAGTFHVSPLLNFEEATQLHTSQTLLACLALFQKNPTGFDYPDILEKMFLPEALEQAKAENARELPELKAKQIHQKVEIFKIDILRTRDDEVLVEVRGQWLRVGLFNGQPFTESPPFKARFTLARNPNLAANGRYPMAVWNYSVE